MYRRQAYETIVGNVPCSSDVIRSSTQIVLTPGYKNCMAGKDWEEEFWVYTSESKYKTPIPAKELFDVREENGTHILTAKEGLNPKLKYKVQLVSKLGELEYPSPLVSISVKAGSANVTMTAMGTTLFAKDKYDLCYDKSLRVRRVVLTKVKELLASYDAILTPACSKLSYEKSCPERI